MKVDFSNAEGFEVIPAGVYPCTITEAEEKESKSSEYPYMKVVLTITEGEYENRKLFLNMSANPKAGWRVKQYLEALGLTTEEMEELEPETLIDKTCSAVVAITTYEGKDRNSVTDLVSADQPKKRRR